VADKEQRQDRGGLMANTTLASAMGPRFTTVDLLLITFWACLLFLCLAILHLLVLLWSLLDGRAHLQIRAAMGELVDTARVRHVVGTPQEHREGRFAATAFAIAKCDYYLFLK
jgi:hypothetical protein